MTTSFDFDDLEHVRQVDRDNMLAHIDALADQFQQAWVAAQQYALPDAYLTPRQIVLCGMGGSAIGGDLLAALIAPTAPVPFTVVRGYDLPAYVASPDTLVIASSHSGNTEETLAAADQAHARGAHLLALTTGGELAEHASYHGYPLWQFDYLSQPRAALGWSFGLLVGLAHRMRLAPALDTDLPEAVALLRKQQPAYTISTPIAANVAKQTAQQITGYLPVIAGAGVFEPVARRWKCQLNENAKVWAQYEPLPEMNHNAVASVSFAAEQAVKLAAVFITSARFDHARVALRHALTEKLCREHGFVTRRFEPQGESVLAQMCHAIQFGDYLSFYTAMAYSKDPTAIEQILELKAQLAQQ